VVQGATLAAPVTGLAAWIKPADCGKAMPTGVQQGIIAGVRATAAMPTSATPVELQLELVPASVYNAAACA
jgi:hypothetical protein